MTTLKVTQVRSSIGCKPKQRGCTRDLRTYCGCDGKIFKGSGSCPRQRHQPLAACGG